MSYIDFWPLSYTLNSEQNTVHINGICQIADQIHDINIYVNYHSIIPVGSIHHPDKYELNNIQSDGVVSWIKVADIQEYKNILYYIDRECDLIKLPCWSESQTYILGKSLNINLGYSLRAQGLNSHNDFTKLSFTAHQISNHSCKFDLPWRILLQEYIYIQISIVKWKWSAVVQAIDPFTIQMDEHEILQFYKLNINQISDWVKQHWNEIMNIVYKYGCPLDQAFTDNMYKYGLVNFITMAPLIPVCYFSPINDGIYENVYAYQLSDFVFNKTTDNISWQDVFRRYGIMTNDKMVATIRKKCSLLGLRDSVVFSRNVILGLKFKQIDKMICHQDDYAIKLKDNDHIINLGWGLLTRPQIGLINKIKSHLLLNTELNLVIDDFVYEADIDIRKMQYDSRANQCDYMILDQGKQHGHTTVLYVMTEHGPVVCNIKNNNDTIIPNKEWYGTIVRKIFGSVKWKYQPINTA